jgi:hypothetical protein
LTCCFALIIGGGTRGHFASASRFASSSLEDFAYCAVRDLDRWSAGLQYPSCY